MSQVFFYLFSVLAVLFGLGVVVNRNPVASALSLVVSFLGLASLYLSLNAYLLGILQILVYAGAIMVLFLFIIMLLDLKAEERGKPNYKTIVTGLVVAFAFVLLLVNVLWDFKPGKITKDEASFDFSEALCAREGKKGIEQIKDELKDNKLPDVKLVGETLFSEYCFQIQIVGLLLLVATIGVVSLSRREAV